MATIRAAIEALQPVGYRASDYPKYVLTLSSPDGSVERYCPERACAQGGRAVMSHSMVLVDEAFRAAAGEDPATY